MDIVSYQEVIYLGDNTPSPYDQRQKQARRRVTEEVGKEPTMSTYDDTQNARKHLRNQIECAFFNAKIDLHQKFGITDDSTPMNGKELVDRILAGKYVLPEENNSYHCYGIIWRDPSVKKDFEGYRAAMDTLNAARQKAEDAAAVLTPYEGLVALDAFRAECKELVGGKSKKK